MMDDATRRRPAGLQVAPAERAPVAWATSWFFFLMTGYYMLRPLRDTAATLFDVQKHELRWAFFGTFIGILIWLSVYAALASLMSRQRLVASVHHFAALVQLLFWWTYRDFGSRPVVYLTLFYIWISVLGLFCVAVVWSALADLFTKEQSERLFGPIAVGATVGGLVGSAAMPRLVEWVGLRHSLLLPLVLFELSLACQWRLERRARRTGLASAAAAPPAAREKPYAGLITAAARIMRSGYLLLITAHLLLHALVGTSVYLLINEIVASEVPVVEQRTALFANVNWYTQLATLPMQAWGTHGLIALLGVPLALSLLPLVYAVAFLGVAWQPALVWLLGADIARRTLTYGLESPIRAMLFTVTPREDRYRTKGFLDTFVVRGGEATSQELVSVLRKIIGSPSAVAGILTAVALVWVGVAYQIGTAYRRTAPDSE